MQLFSNTFNYVKSFVISPPHDYQLYHEDENKKEILKYYLGLMNKPISLNKSDKDTIKKQCNYMYDKLYYGKLESKKYIKI